MSALAPEIGSKSKATAADNSGSEQGKMYEKLLFTLLAKNAYQLSKDGKFKDGEFSIGREIGMALDMKFDDIVFSYKGMSDTNNLVFFQIKHMQNENQVINYKILSTEEWKAKGNLQENFNLQKYFISFLRIREELKNATSEELKGGKIKHVVLYTNVGLNTKKLNLKSNDDDSLNDIKSILSFEKSTSRHPESIGCYQLNDVSDELHKIFHKSSDLHRIARELAQHVLGEDHRKSHILGKGETAVNFYQVVLEREVIRKFPKKLVIGKESYCVAYFRDDFIEDDEPGSKRELRDAIFQAMAELAESGMDTSEDKLKLVLKKAKMKVTTNFGKIKHKRKKLPCKWMSVNKSDIDDFLKCFVLFVNQPNATFLITQIYSETDSILKGTPIGQALDNIYPKFKDRIEKELGLHEKASRKEMWLSGEKIMQFVQEQKEAINISIFSSLYEERIMQYGVFIGLGELEVILDSFLNYKRNKEIPEKRHVLLKECNVLSVFSENTLLSTIKILQHLNTKNYSAEKGQISIELGDLMEMRDRVEKAFSSETYKLLIIECRRNVTKQNAEEICSSFSALIKSRRNKKIILINKQGEPNVLAERFSFYLEKRFKNICDPEKAYIQETDDIDLKDFEPAENSLEKEVIVFQGEEEKISLARLTGFKHWNSYVFYLSQDKILNKAVIADIMIEILNNDEIEVGSKPPGTSSLEGAHDTLFEEINLDTLLHKLFDMGNIPLEDDSLEDEGFAIFQETNSAALVQNLDNNPSEIFIFHGIKGLTIKEKMHKLAEYLGVVNEQNKIASLLGDIESGIAIQMAYDNFKDENFKQICRDHPKRKIFWIGVKDKENEIKFILQGFYNPNFYLKRKFKKFKKVIDKKVKNLLMEDNLAEKFVFSCVSNLDEFMESLDLRDETEKRKVEINYKNSFIRIRMSKDAAEVAFQELCEENQTVHWLSFENNQIMWCNTHGSLNKLWGYIDHKESETDLVDEDNLIKYIRYRKVVIIADEPGMGKTTTLTKLYESEPFLEKHWVVAINLRDHIQAIKKIQLANGNIDVVNFLAKFDIKLNHNLSKSLLRFALDKNKNILKPLLIVFDGFDEVLDLEDRSKLISLLKFLKEETAAKIWITTRLHYKEFLESELYTFAIEFDPLNDDSKAAYIKNYLKDRMCLILSEKKFAEVFVHNDKMQENESIKIYIYEFLNKIKSVFKSNTSEFIGTPLQLYLMLEGSVSHFKDWVENNDAKNPNFDYLGVNILQVYKHFLNKKYRIYFKKMDINEGVRQKEDKYIFSQYNKNFARSLIFKSKPKKTFEKFGDMILSAAIIKSHGSNLEFIHSTFRDYFAAKVFIRWIKGVPNEPFKTHKQEYILKEILRNPDYQLIRTFIDLKLKKYEATESFKESVKQYGMMAEKLLKENFSLMDDKGTALHKAVEEGNKNIVCFFINIFIKHKYVLKKFLFHRTVAGKSALDLIFVKHDIEILRLLLDAAADISDKTLQEFLHFYDKHGRNVLDVAAVSCKNFELVKELLNRAENKLDLVMNENKKHSTLNVALRCGNKEFVMFLIQEFKHDENSLKRLLLFYDKDYSNTLGVALRYDTSMVEFLLCTAKAMKDRKSTLREMLLPEKHVVPLRFALSTRKIHFVKMILNAAKDINEDTLMRMFLKDVTQESLFLSAATIGKGDITELLLRTAARLGKEVLEKFVFAVNKDGNNALHLMVQSHYFQERSHFIYIFKLLLKTAASLGEEVLEKLVFASNKDGKTSIHLMVEFAGRFIFDVFDQFVNGNYKSISRRAMEILRSMPQQHDYRPSRSFPLESSSCGNLTSWNSFQQRHDLWTTEGNVSLGPNHPNKHTISGRMAFSSQPIEIKSTCRRKFP